MTVSRFFSFPRLHAIDLLPLLVSLLIVRPKRTFPIRSNDFAASVFLVSSKTNFTLPINEARQVFVGKKVRRGYPLSNQKFQLIKMSNPREKNPRYFVHRHARYYFLFYILVINVLFNYDKEPTTLTINFLIRSSSLPKVPFVYLHVVQIRNPESKRAEFSTYANLSSFVNVFFKERNRCLICGAVASAKRFLSAPAWFHRDKLQTPRLPLCLTRAGLRVK